MSANPTLTLHHALAGATIGGGFIELVTMNATFITTIAIALTSVAGFGFGILSKVQTKRRNDIEDRRVRAIEEANRISEATRYTNERDIIERLITKFTFDDTDYYTTEDIKLMLRK